MIIVYKYRAYPTKAQKKIIDSQLEICRQIYNRTLNRKISEYKKDKKNLSLYDLHRELTIWKKDDPQLSTIHSQVLRNSQERVDLAYKNFFRRLKTGKILGFPKEKEPGRLRSLAYAESGFKFLSKHTQLSKIGKIKTIFHRQLTGKVKRLSLIKYPSGKFFICIVSEINETPTIVDVKTSVGIDLGCSHFAVLSDGQIEDSPKFLKKNLKKISSKQFKNKPVTNLHEKVANQRNDFLHKLANKIINRYDLIIVEDLDIQSMSKIKKSFSKNFRRTITDNGWSIFINMLKYKAVIAGKHFVKVDPSYTSQDCSNCGNRKKLELSERSYCCDVCGLLIDRDLNASQNILRLGMQSIGENPLKSSV